ncbi:hypothetical protein WJX74_007917 [Apatococcus lobatus]|uniref:thioredoxin-dependent peroxiredoxin n=1 Tax=Apatococcus lobatus TaxID=904363 RepID=A0AAW1RCD8_9CHLO
MSTRPQRPSLIARRRPGRQTLLPRAALSKGESLDDYSDYFRVLKSTSGSSVALSNFKGKKPVVLFFYPAASSPGCTKQACSFRDAYGKFVDAGAEVFGISSDDLEKNRKFAKEQRLPFPLLCDQGSFLRKSFGIKSDLLGLLPGRQTFIIDKSGKCVLSFNDQFGAEKHVGEALKVIEQVA